MIYIIGIIFIIAIFIGDNTTGATAAQNITQSMTETNMQALDLYVQQCYTENYTLNIPQSLAFVGEFSKEVAETTVNEFSNIYRLLPEKYQAYLIDMIASIKTNANLNQIFNVTNQPISETTAIAEFKHTKIMFLDDVDSIRKDMATTPTPTTTSIRYHNTILACLVVTVAIAAFTTKVLLSS